MAKQLVCDLCSDNEKDMYSINNLSIIDLPNIDICEECLHSAVYDMLKKEETSKELCIDIIKLMNKNNIRNKLFLNYLYTHTTSDLKNKLSPKLNELIKILSEEESSSV